MIFSVNKKVLFLIPVIVLCDGIRNDSSTYMYYMGLNTRKSVIGGL